MIKKIIGGLSLTCIIISSHAQINQSLNTSDTLTDLKKLQSKVIRKNGFLHAAKVPAILITLGAYSSLSKDVINRYEVREERNEHLPHFRTHVDNYLQYANIGVLYGLNVAGIKARNDFRNRTLLMVKSEMIMAALTFSLKSITHERRPDGSDYQSFPSGHTAQAFATATMVSKEYGGQSIWYSIGAYSMATTVGVMRVLNNRHWVSDVFAGAGIGILSTNIAYLTHRYRWKNKSSNLTVIPTYSNGPGVYVGYIIK